MDALVGLRDSPFLTRCKRITRLRLQAELYSLTQVPAGLTFLLPAIPLNTPPLSKNGMILLHAQQRLPALCADRNNLWLHTWKGEHLGNINAPAV